MNYVQKSLLLLLKSIKYDDKVSLLISTQFPLLLIENHVTKSKISRITFLTYLLLFIY